jgi:hypothetical protein
MAGERDRHPAPASTLEESMCRHACPRIFRIDHDLWCADCRREDLTDATEQCTTANLAASDPTTRPGHQWATAREWLEYLDLIAPKVGAITSN